MVLICGQERRSTRDGADLYSYNFELAMLCLSRDARPPLYTDVTIPQERGGKKVSLAISCRPP